jgi:hypothetical protein
MVSGFGAERRRNNAFIQYVNYFNVSRMQCQLTSLQSDRGGLCAVTLKYC